MVCPSSHAEVWYASSSPSIGTFLTFFMLLVIISFGEKQIRIANQRFILPCCNFDDAPGNHGTLTSPRVFLSHIR